MSTIFKSQQGGFTLLEVLIVVTLMSVLSVLAWGGYHRYITIKEQRYIQQEMTKIALALERHKFKNFTYQGFDVYALYPLATSDTQREQSIIQLPEQKFIYQVQILDFDEYQPIFQSTVFGRDWIMIATPISPTADQEDMLLSSTGLQCKMSHQQGFQPPYSCQSPATDW